MDSVYSVILVSRAKRASLFFAVFVMVFVLASFLFANLVYDVNWLVFIVPLLLLCSILLIFPVSEEWAYRPCKSIPSRSSVTISIDSWVHCMRTIAIAYLLMLIAACQTIESFLGRRRRG